MTWRKIRWAVHVSQMGAKWNVYRLLVGKLEGKRPLGRPRLWLTDNIKMNLFKIELGDVDWIGQVQMENCCELGNEPSGSIKCCETTE
jgi:hypothetical protein